MPTLSKRASENLRGTILKRRIHRYPHRRRNEPRK